MSERTDYRPEIIIAVIVGLIVLVCIFLSGCADPYYYPNTSMDEFDMEMRMQQSEQQMRRIQQQRMYESMGIRVLPY